MKLMSFRILLLTLVALTATASFMASRWKQCPTRSSCTEGHAPPVTQALKEDFQTEARKLRSKHRHARKQLGHDLLDPSMADEAIAAQADIVIKANNDLFRFVIERLLDMGPNLNAEQKHQLFAYCGQITQDAHRRPYTSGPHTTSQSNNNKQACPSCPSKQKHGDCTGLSNQLQLTQEQFDIAAQANPNFAKEARQLGAMVCHSHQELIALLTNHPLDRHAIKKQTETFLQARTQLEQRIVDYIIAIRPCLKHKQITQLTGMCGH